MEKQTFNHPSYGMVSFSRVSHGGGKTVLFGSPLSEHSTTIRLKIQPAERQFSLAQDRFFGTTRLPLVEIELSAAQFSELLTCMNMGDGVPCTIRYANGVRIENPPAQESESELVRRDFAASVKKLLGDKVGAVRASIESAKLSAKDRTEILKAVDLLVQHIRADLPFVEESFREATERTVKAAKAEVDAFTTSVLTRLGFQSLQQARRTLSAKEDDSILIGDGK